MTGKLFVLFVLVASGWLAACATPERKVAPGPQSEVDSKPWNRPQPGEGEGMFGGALQKR